MLGSVERSRSNSQSLQFHISINVVEERLNVGKRDVNNGSVRVRPYTVETPVSETVNLRNEDDSVERRSVDRPVADADAAFPDRTIEAEEYREEADFRARSRS